LAACAFTATGKACARTEAAWMQFINMIRGECPHCRVDHLVVVDGAAWGYGYIDFTRARPRDAQRAAPEPSSALNADWRWFIGECQALRDGIISEVHFRDGNPVTIRGVKTAMGRIDGLIGGDKAGRRMASALA